LEPQTFSPDNDGFNDVLNVNYAFVAPGNVANIEIMDTDGRPIKILSQNELLAISGTISWDGSSDNSLKARAGMYIVHFQIFNEKGENQRFKKVCVLAVNF
jgi:flagellar hook assembly protein FlgD